MRIFAALKQYNANVSDKRTTDCVPRAISHALGLPYERVLLDLKHIGKYNAWTTIDKYLLDKLGEHYTWIAPIEKERWSNLKTSESGWITVDEFCQEHPSGTYILGTGPKNKQENHLVCIIDGDAWDSWNSLNECVYRYWKVTDQVTEMHTADIHDVVAAVKTPLENYIIDLSAKMKYIDLSVRWNKPKDPYTCTFDVYADPTEEMPKYVFFSYFGRVHHTFAIKISPRGTSEEDISRIFKLVKQKVYDWVYNTRKEVEDEIKARERRAARPKYSGSNQLLAWLPEWAVSLATWGAYSENISPDYGDKFELLIEALPEDPSAESNPEVYFAADTLSELKSDLEAYRKRFSRPY